MRLRGLGERFSSPSGSGQSPAAKRYLVNFRLKISPLVAAIFRSFSGNETSNWGDWISIRPIFYFFVAEVMSNYLTTDGLKKNSLLPEAPLRPEARGICHICHMVNPALGTQFLERLSPILSLLIGVLV